MTSNIGEAIPVSLSSYVKLFFMFHVFFDRNSTDHFRGSRGSISNSMGIIQNFEKIRRTLLGFSVFHCNIKMVSHLLLTPFPVVSTCLTCFYRRLLNYSSSYRGRQLTQLSKGISSKFISRDGSGAVPKETHAIFSWTRRGSQLRSGSWSQLLGGTFYFRRATFLWATGQRFEHP